MRVRRQCEFVAGDLSDPSKAALPIAAAACGGSSSGKCVGVFGGTYVFARFTKASRDDDLAWSDVLGLSLWPASASACRCSSASWKFGVGSARDDHVRLGVLMESLTSAVLAAIVLQLRNPHYKRVEIEETRDDDADGVPDVYAKRDPAIGS